MATQPGCNDAKVTLVSRIKQSANKAGIHTVRDMALQSGVSKSGVDKIYNLRSFPTFDTLLAMANACGCTVHDWTAGLVQDADARGKRPEQPKRKPKPNKPEPEQPQPRKPEPEQPQPEPEQPEPHKAGKAGTKVDLLAMLHGKKPE